VVSGRSEWKSPALQTPEKTRQDHNPNGTKRLAKENAEKHKETGGAVEAPPIKKEVK
jgi:hypothetical protein